MRDNFQRMFTLFVLAGRFLLERQVTATHDHSLRPVHATCQTDRWSLRKTQFLGLKLFTMTAEQICNGGNKVTRRKRGIHLLTEDNSIRFYTFSASSEETEGRLCHRLCFCSPFKQSISGKTKTSALSVEPTPKRSDESNGASPCRRWSKSSAQLFGSASAARRPNRWQSLLWFETSRVGTGHNFFLSAGVIRSLPR